MDYIKPEIIELNTGSAEGQKCDFGFSNYSTGCTTGPGNDVNCVNGPGFGSGQGCTPLGLIPNNACNYGIGPP